MPSEAARKHKPRADLATLQVDAEGWWIELSPHATVIELAVLMHGLSSPVRAVHVGDGAFRIYPQSPGTTPAPTGEQIRDILTAGFPEPIPSLVMRAD